MPSAYAIIFIESFENSFLSSCPLKPTANYRCNDNIFMIWPHGLDKFIVFLTMLAIHTTILLSHMQFLVLYLFHMFS